MRLARSLPWFDGHFPGHPVLPGVAQLIMVDDLLRAEKRCISGFARLRFRQEVFPGDEIAIETRNDVGSKAVRFTVQRDDVMVADGLSQVRPEESILPLVAPATSLPTLATPLPNIETLVPHRGAMRFVDGLVSSTAEATTALASVSPSSPFARVGFAPILLAIEMAAQAAAAGESLARLRATGAASPREGRLVGASDVELVASRIPVGHRLLVSIVLVQSAPPMQIYQASVRDGETVLATGKVSTYLV